MRAIAVLISLIMAAPAFAAKSNRCAEVADSVAEYDKATHKFKGCRLSAVEKGSLHARLGLKPGDLVQPSNQYKIDRDVMDLELHLSQTEDEAAVKKTE